MPRRMRTTRFLRTNRVKIMPTDRGSPISAKSLGVNAHPAPLDPIRRKILSCRVPFDKLTVLMLKKHVYFFNSFNA